MSKGLLAQWRRGLLGRGLTGALLLAVPVATAAVIGLSGGFGSVTGGLSELTTGPQATFSAAPPADGLNTAVVAVAGGDSPRGTTPGGQPGGDNPSGGGGGGGTTPTTGGGGNATVPNVVPDVPQLPGAGGGGNGGPDVNGTVDQVVGGVNDTVNGVLGGN
jgi:hypothetical protein